jgi:hypothetical protein
MAIGNVYRVDGSSIFTKREVEMNNFPENIWTPYPGSIPCEDKYLKLVAGVLKAMTSTEKLAADSAIAEKIRIEILVNNSVLGNAELTNCDWTQLADVVGRGTLTTEQVAAWVSYRAMVYTEKNKDVVLDWEAIKAQRPS